MIYSDAINKISEEAGDIARAMDSINVNAPHVIIAALRFGCVEEAFRKAGADIDALKQDLQKEGDAAPKMRREHLERYRAARVTRQMRHGVDMQNVLAEANTLASGDSGWNTEYVEISHMMMAIFKQAACGSVSKHVNGASKAEMLINELIKYESAERRIKAIKFKFSGAKSSQTKRSTTSKAADISEFCTDMVSAVVNDDKPFIGRTQELAALMECLERRDKPNAILTGAPGVGKTDVVRGLAKKLLNEEVPEQLQGAHLYCVDIPAMLAGTQFRGDFEKRLKDTIEAAVKQDRPILFIDEIHMVLGAGKTMDSSMDAANILKPYLTEGKIRVIGATTKDEFRKYVEKDAAFMRRFQEIDVSEPSPSEAVKILEGVKPAYEAFHSVKIQKDAMKAAVDLSVRHMHDRFLPDKAIDLIDQTCAHVKLEQGKKITVADIEQTVAKLCKVPAATVQKDEMSKVRTLGENLKAQVFGQDEAIEHVTESVQMAKSGLGDESKPIGSFLFVGPSGVGKTEVSKQLAYSLGIDFIRFDMSEYAEPHTIAKLIGSPAGYVGYDDGGLLVEKIRQHPNSVVLFDEIEKAHPDIYKIFLQILDYGMLSDNKGRKADFRNTIIIMTSNAGNAAAEKRKVGFGDNTSNDRKATCMNAVKDMMAPELRGRMTATIVFNPLNTDVAKLIVKKELKKLTNKLKAKKINVSYTDEAIDELVKRGVSAQYGAREIQRVIDNNIKKMFVKKIVDGNAEGEYKVDIENGEFVLKEKLMAMV